jgi:hypothetical protein
VSLDDNGDPNESEEDTEILPDGMSLIVENNGVSIPEEES